MEGKTLSEYDLKNTRNCLELFKDYIINTYKEKLKENKEGKPWNSIASGRLYNSVQGDFVINDNNININIDLTEYWRDLEEGQKPGTEVPIGDLIRWIRIKPVLPRQGKGGKIPTEEELAVLIRNKIKREGTEPTYFMSKSVDEAFEIFKDRLRNAISDDLNDIIYVKINNVFGKN